MMSRTNNFKVHLLNHVNILVVILTLICQYCFWLATHHIRPQMDIVPPLPSQFQVKALSLGDTQFYFRQGGWTIQNAGDTFGRFTALKHYNYKRLSMWFDLLDSLDSTSNFIPSLASYYYSQTQHVPDVIYIVNYLEKHAKHDLHTKWWWLAQGMYLAKNRLKDNERALDLAYQLAAIPNDTLPQWTKEMPAFILSDMGEREEAYKFMKNILDSSDKLTPGEQNFIIYFIKERLQYLHGVDKTIVPLD